LIFLRNCRMATLVPIVTIGFDVPDSRDDERYQESFGQSSILSNPNLLQPGKNRKSLKLISSKDTLVSPRKLTHDLDDPEEHAQFSKALEEILTQASTEVIHIISKFSLFQRKNKRKSSFLVPLKIPQLTSTPADLFEISPKKNPKTLLSAKYLAKAHSVK
jgi:hypothetical protein